MNVAAIHGLLAAHAAIRSDDHCIDREASLAFAQDLIRLVEKEKPITVTIDGRAFEFGCDDIRVEGTTVHFGEANQIDLSYLEDGLDGHYEMTVLCECPGDPIGVTVSLFVGNEAQGSFLPAAAKAGQVPQFFDHLV